MADAILATWQGNDYQAIMFWTHACRLLKAKSNVSAVGFEVNDAKSFDDVVVQYNSPIRCERGDHVIADYHQVKFHVAQDNTIKWTDLADPKFIGAQSFSLLMKLRDMQAGQAQDGFGCRFYIHTPWHIDANDDLRKIVSNDGGEIRFSKLFDGHDGSWAGKIRKAWCSHLGISSDDELMDILRPLRIMDGQLKKRPLIDMMSANTECVGLKPVADGAIITNYVELIKNARIEGKTHFDRDGLLALCRAADLCCGSPQGPDGISDIGIRSFMRWAEDMGDETDDHLCLVEHFDDRHILDSDLWHSSVYPGVSKFLSSAIKGKKTCRVHLDTHCSIAFAVGYCLDYKCGVEAIPVQRTRSGKLVWEVSNPPADGSAGLSWNEIDADGDGNDVAVSISISRNANSDVQTFVKDSLPSVRRVIDCSISSTTGNNSVRDGAHAMSIAEEIVSELSKLRTPTERKGLLHLFISAPNGLVFFLGQLAHGLGRCVLYEYDFGTCAPGAYQQSLILPQ